MGLSRLFSAIRRLRLCDKISLLSNEEFIVIARLYPSLSTLRLLFFSEAFRTCLSLFVTLLEVLFFLYLFSLLFAFFLSLVLAPFLSFDVLGV